MLCRSRRSNDAIHPPADAGPRSRRSLAGHGLYFIPSVPMAMPSLMVGVPNVAICRLPDALTAASASAEGRSCGVMVEWPLATPISGFSKSFGWYPSA